MPSRRVRLLTPQLGEAGHLDAPAPIKSVRALASGGRGGLIVGCQTGSLAILGDDGRTRAVHPRAHTSSVFAVAADRESKHFVSGGKDGLKVWAADGRLTLSAPSFKDIVQLEFQPHGSLLAISTRAAIHVVPAGAWSTSRAHLVGCSATWSPDGKSLGVADTFGTLRIHEVPSFRVVRTLAQPAERRLSDLSWSPDGRFLAGLLGTKGLWIWDLEDEARSQLLRSATAMGLVWTPSSKLIAALPSGANPVWDPKASSVGAPRPTKGYVGAIAWAHDGSSLVTASGTVAQVWSPTGGTSLATLEHRGLKLAGESRRVGAVAITREGKILTQVRPSGHVLLWSREGRFIGAIQPSALEMALNPKDGMLALVGPYDKIHHVDPAKPTPRPNAEDLAIPAPPNPLQAFDELEPRWSNAAGRPIANADPVLARSQPKDVEDRGQRRWPRDRGPPHATPRGLRRAEITQGSGNRLQVHGPEHVDPRVGSDHWGRAGAVSNHPARPVP